MGEIYIPQFKGHAFFVVQIDIPLLFDRWVRKGPVIHAIRDHGRFIHFLDGPDAPTKMVAVSKNTLE
jgi:hypothetical protein